MDKKNFLLPSKFNWLGPTPLLMPLFHWPTFTIASATILALLLENCLEVTPLIFNAASKFEKEKERLPPPQSSVDDDFPQQLNYGELGRGRKISKTSKNIILYSV